MVAMLKYMKTLNGLGITITLFRMNCTREKIQEAIYELNLQRKVSPEDVRAVILYLDMNSKINNNK